MKKIILFILLTMSITINSQETVGLVYNDVNSTKSSGYTLFNSSDDKVHLINNCGELVNVWDYSGNKSISTYFLENGNLLQVDRNTADIRDWDNNILWSVNFNTLLGVRFHHDIEPLPNGNFLILVKDRYTKTEMIANGKDSSFEPDTFVLEKIVEIEPVGTDSAKIVWEWKYFDHLVQDFDDSKPNFGSIAGNPQLLDMNYAAENSVDYIHANGIDYNEELDQIIISARHINEIMIIDHSTTTSEAASSTGGNSGKGGDFLWRWGNPEVYDGGTSEDQKLGQQHDPKWIKFGPHKGKISVFSNEAYGSDATYSSIHIIEPIINNGNYQMSSNKFLPVDYTYSWDGTILNEVMFGAIKSGVQVMSNGNILINESTKGRVTEIDAQGNVIWVYEIPVTENIVFDQFSTPTGNGSFRATRYSEDYAGFNNVTFKNTGIIENENAISTTCKTTLSINNTYFNNLSVFPNPTNGQLSFIFDKNIESIEVFDLTGKIVLTNYNTKSINIEKLKSGLYIVKVSIGEQFELLKIMKN
ncbi:aryl-sulfate sulfotransferase [Polaribacter sp.]|uniref:aryl-sulfate sulfotransferase n=1 Tax=Polaribacter sp. TaxID=1920175 RepID=UPI003F6B7B08